MCIRAQHHRFVFHLKKKNIFFSLQNFKKTKKKRLKENNVFKYLFNQCFLSVSINSFFLPQFFLTQHSSQFHFHQTTFFLYGYC